MVQRIKVLITILNIIALLFPNSRLMICSIFSNDFPKIRNLPKIFLKSFENVSSKTPTIHKLVYKLADLLRKQYNISTGWAS